jgi:hypothetical protein
LDLGRYIFLKNLAAAEAIKFNNDEGIEFMFTKLETSDNISSAPFFP